VARPPGTVLSVRAILVVDDDSVDREAATRCLEPLQDLAVSYAADGSEAVEAIARKPPDLILTDLRMPRMDGLELVEWIRSEHPLVPVVLMTAKGSEQIAVKALKAGAASYVAKTDMKHTLADTITQVLEVQEARRGKAEAVRYLSSSDTRFDLDNDPDLIAGVVGYLQDNLERLGYDETLKTHIGISLMEAIGNAMIHGNLEVDSALRRAGREHYQRMIDIRRAEEPYSLRRVRCIARETPRQVEYVVEDEGPGFDPGMLPDPTTPENLLEVTGRGIMLMSTFMDKIEFNETGNRITLAKANTAACSGEPTH